MKKPPAGSLGIKSNGYEHLMFVPGVARALNDPEVRNRLLLLEWEGEAPSKAGGVLFSKRCANRENQPIGLGFTAALVKAAVEGEQ